MKATVKRTGPTPEQSLAIAQERLPPRLLARVHAAMDRMGDAYNKTGTLRRGLIVRRTATGYELVPPSGRLETTNARNGFIQLLALYLGTVQ